MNAVIETMLRQFDEMKIIAEQNAAIADKALDERDQARAALLDAELQLLAHVEWMCTHAPETDLTQTKAVIERCRIVLEKS